MKVAILGAGYAGVTVARRLERDLPSDVDLVVVNESSDHLVQHELHRVVRRPAFADDITIDLADMLDRAQLRVARVTDVHPEHGYATLDDGRLEYDFAAVCLGAETAFHGLPGVAEHATPLKRVDHARAIRARFLDLVDAGGTVVVGGGGLSGIQVAGELAELAVEEHAGDRIDIVLVEQLDAVAPGFPRQFRTAVRDELTTRGIDVRTDTAIQRATASSVETDAGRIGCDQFVWTGGIRGPHALGGERWAVQRTLRVGAGTFVVGDAADVTDRDGQRVPASAQAAVREGRTAATNIQRLLEYERTGGVFEPRLESFAFEPAAWIVSVGDGAVAAVGPTVLRGHAALALKATAGVGYLTSIGAVERVVDLVVEEFGG